MDSINIIEAQVSDAKHIALLGRVTFSETFGHLFREKKELYEYYERTFSVEKIRKSLKKPNNVFWIASVNELPVGYAKLKLDSPSAFIDSKNVSQLQKIYVLKDFLSMKIGLKIQEKIMLRAKEHGSEYIWLSVLDENDRAINFYYKNKFVELGNHNFQIGQEKFEFITMSKKII